jgi:dipeptidyl aminopeptidase/acylaminoacyl peptidase
VTLVLTHRVCWLAALGGLLAALPAPARAQTDAPLPVSDALLARSFGHDEHVSIAPDGKAVVFTLHDNHHAAPADSLGLRRAYNGDDVWVVDVATGRMRLVSDGRGHSAAGTWSPDGRAVAFFASVGDTSHAYVWDRATAHARQVAGLPIRALDGYGERPQWTADGRALLVRAFRETRRSGATDSSSVDLAPSPSSDTTDPVRRILPGAKVTLLPSEEVLAASPEVSAPDTGNGKIRYPEFTIYAGDVALIDVAAGTVRQIARGFNPVWFQLSPDGQSLALLHDEGQRGPGAYDRLQALVVVGLASGKATVLQAGIVQALGWGRASWSPDSRSIAYVESGPNFGAAADTARHDCFLASLADGRVRNVTPGVHPPLMDYYRPPIWDAAGRYLYLFGLDRPNRARSLWRVSLSDGTARELAAIEGRQMIDVVGWAETGRFWSPDAGRSLVIHTRADSTNAEGFYAVDFTSGLARPLFEEAKSFGVDIIPRSALTTSVSADGRTIAWVVQDAAHAPEVFVSGPKLTPRRRVTTLNPVLDQYRLGTSRLLTWRSDDGIPLRGALLLPAGYVPGRRYPLIVYQYPGDFKSNLSNAFGLSYGDAYNWQLFATRGYAVLLPDVVARAGTYMRDIASSVLPGVNAAVEAGVADPDRVGVFGWSSGGYSTLALIVQTTRFRAAIAGAGFSDWIAMYGEGGWSDEESVRIGGTLWEKRDLFIENSPIFYLDRVETPLLLIHGANDGGVRPAYSEQVYTGLRRLGKPVLYASYGGEDHVIQVFENQVDLVERMIAWFDKYLGAR